MKFLSVISVLVLATSFACAANAKGYKTLTFKLTTTSNCNPLAIANQHKPQMSLISDGVSTTASPKHINSECVHFCAQICGANEFCFVNCINEMC